MRILVFENEPSSKRGGQELSLLDVCRGLAARSHTIDLLYVKSGDLLDDYRQFCSNIIPTTSYTVDRTRTLRASTQWLLSLIERGKVARQADVLYTNQYHDTLFAGALGTLLQKPVVCHARLPPPDPACGQHRLGIRRVTRFIAISHAARSEWIKSGFALAQDIDVVHNGIDPERFKPTGCRIALRSQLGISRDSLTVLFVGRFGREKGIDVLLRAFGIVRCVIPEARLLMAGGPPSAYQDQPYFDELCQMGRELGLDDSVQWLGRRSDVSALCEAADVLAMPSDWPELFGRALVESMSCGTPAIGAAVGGIPEVLSGEFERGIFQARNDQALAQRILDVCQWRRADPDLPRRCREWVIQNFHIDATVAGVEASLQRALVLGRRRASAKEVGTLTQGATG
jgi:glycosyltransferase involved in cell wall biosynthesis